MHIKDKIPVKRLAIKIVWWLWVKNVDKAINIQIIIFSIKFWQKLSPKKKSILKLIFLMIWGTMNIINDSFFNDFFFQKLWKKLRKKKTLSKKKKGILKLIFWMIWVTMNIINDYFFNDFFENTLNFFMTFHKKKHFKSFFWKIWVILNILNNIFFHEILTIFI